MTHHVQRPATRVPRVVAPADLDEALRLMAAGGAKPIAGGTDLMVELDRGEHGAVSTLIDLTRIAGLDSIDEADGTITIGPLVTHNRCVDSALLRRRAWPLVQACWEVGSPQLRNRATVAGNIVTASPANDTLSALVALDAEVTLASVRGRRRLPLSALHLGVRRTAIEPDELLVAIAVPAIDERWRGVYLKLGLRRAQAISVVHLAAVCRLSDEPSPGSPPVVTELRLALGSVAPTIVRAEAAEQLVVGTTLGDDVIGRAATAAGASVEPIDDLRATADYRTAMVTEMTGRALRALRDGTVVLPVEPPMLWGRSAGRWPTGPELAADHVESTPVTATVNGVSHSAPWAGTTLLDWLRDGGFTGSKEGCAEGECGSCTVDLDGMAVLSCLVPATRAHRADIVTIEGLAPITGNGATAALHPLQQAFVDTGAVQCGYCIPGFLVSGAKLLEEHPAPTEEQIKAGLSGNLCRCTGYYKIEDAVRVALSRDGADG